MISYSDSPLVVDEIINCFLSRWEVSYDMQIIVREKRLYLQVMWGYLEQQSFPLDEDQYKAHLNEIVEIINRIEKSGLVREFFTTTSAKPRLGKAITLKLIDCEGLEEFDLSLSR